MLILKIAFKGKCDKHPRYAPTTEGEGGIKSGCSTCYQLLSVWKAATNFREIADKFNHTPQMEPQGDPTS